MRPMKNIDRSRIEKVSSRKWIWDPPKRERMHGQTQDKSIHDSVFSGNK